MSEIKLSGGEITILKTLGLTGAQMAGTQLVDRIAEMEDAEFLDTLTGLIDQDYVVANRVNIRTIDSVSGRLSRQCGRFPRIARGDISLPAGEAGYGKTSAAGLIIE